MLLPLPWVCQMTPPSRLRDPLLRGLDAEVLVRPGHLLLARVEDDEVADQVEQARLARTSAPAACRAASRVGSAGAADASSFHCDEELLRRAGGAVAQALRIAAREDQLHRAEEALVEDLFLVGDELAHAVGHFHRAALQFDHADGDAVQVKHQIRPALVAALERHLFGQGEVVLLRVLPVDQMHSPRAAARRRSAPSRRSAAVGRCAGWPGRASRRWCRRPSPASAARRRCGRRE